MLLLGPVLLTLGAAHAVCSVTTMATATLIVWSVTDLQVVRRAAAAVLRDPVSQVEAA